MKLDANEIAFKLYEQGYTSRDVDTSRLEKRIIKMLKDRGFFDDLQAELEGIESEDEKSLTRAEYLEKIGEV